VAETTPLPLEIQQNAENEDARPDPEKLRGLARLMLSFLARSEEPEEKCAPAQARLK
jgi:hypothetical protein